MFNLSDPLNEGSTVDLDVMKLSDLKVGLAGTLAKEMVEDLAANRIQIPSLTGEEIILTREAAFIFKLVEIAQVGNRDGHYTAGELVTLAYASDELLKQMAEVADWVMDEKVVGDGPDPLESSPS